jgi:hypothetical protein
MLGPPPGMLGPPLTGMLEPPLTGMLGPPLTGMLGPPPANRPPVGGPAGEAGDGAPGARPPCGGPSVRKRSRGPADEVGREAGDTGRDAGETGRDAGDTGRDIGSSGALPESGTTGIGPEVDGSSGRRPSSSAGAPCRVA